MLDEAKVKKLFAGHITRLRKSRHMTQRDLGDVLGVAVSTVSDWEQAKKLPRAGVIEKISREFGVAKSSLFEEEEERENSITLDNEMEFISKLHVSVEKLLDHFILTFEGRELSEDEAKFAINFFRNALKANRQ